VRRKYLVVVLSPVLRPLPAADSGNATHCCIKIRTLSR
jgi:hypothetical protein